MRILVVTGAWFPDAIGGAARVAHSTSECLAVRGNDIDVIAPRVRSAAPSAPSNGPRLHRTIRRSAMPFTLTDVYEMRHAIRKALPSGYDVLLTHGQTAGFAALTIDSRPPVSLVFHASGYREARHRRASGLSVSEQLRSLGVEPFLYAFERFALRRADQILVLSDFSKGLVTDVEPRAHPRIFNVGGGVGLETFRPAPHRAELRSRLGVAAGELLLLTARRLVPRMGVDMLIDTIATLRANGRAVRLIVIGDGELRPALTRYRDQRGLRPIVQFLGRVPDEELVDWYRAADIFVLPTTAYEGYGMVTAEALACGTPVVATNVGASREILYPLDPRLVADLANPESLSQTIEVLLGYLDESYRTRCARYAVDRLGWAHTILRWEEALLAIAGRGP